MVALVPSCVGSNPDEVRLSSAAGELRIRRGRHLGRAGLGGGRDVTGAAFAAPSETPIGCDAEGISTRGRICSESSLADCLLIVVIIAIIT